MPQQRIAKPARPSAAGSTSPRSAPGPAPAAQPGAPDPLVFQLLNEIGIIGQLSQNRAARLLSPGLNLSQFTVLNHFTRLGGERSLVQLANAMQVTKGAMSNTIARLLAKGLVAVHPDPDDGRGKRVSLTPAGLAARQRALRQLMQGLAEVADSVPEAELAPALAVLRRLRRWFDEHR